MKEQMASLGLGTVQLGLDYGLTNTTGMPTRQTTHAILELARTADIGVLDTARLYGTSEAVVGNYLATTDWTPRVITKLAVDTSTPETTVTSAQASLTQSLGALRRETVDGLLAHDCRVLLGECGDTLWQTMRSMRDSGTTTRIGASLYDPSQLAALMSRYDLDLIQIPANVFDQRFVRSDALARFHAQGGEVHVRSVFLQGLVFMNEDTLPRWFAPVRETITGFASACRAAGTEPFAAALKYALTCGVGSTCLVGVQSPAQLSQLLAVVERLADIPEVDCTDFALDDPRWVDPSRWEVS